MREILPSHSRKTRYVLTDVFRYTTITNRLEVSSLRCEIYNETEQDLVKWLEDEGVGIKMNTPTIILIINGTSTLEYIKVEPLRVKTCPYVPDPMRCFRCCAYGYTKQRYKGEANYQNCSNVHNLESECTANASIAKDLIVDQAAAAQPISWKRRSFAVALQRIFPTRRR